MSDFFFYLLRVHHSHHNPFFLLSPSLYFMIGGLMLCLCIALWIGNFLCYADTSASGVRLKPSRKSMGLLLLLLLHQLSLLETAKSSDHYPSRQRCSLKFIWLETTNIYLVASGKDRYCPNSHKYYIKSIDSAGLEVLLVHSLSQFSSFGFLDH